MLDGVRINGIRQNSQYVFKPTAAKGAAFYDGCTSGSPAEREAYQWIQAVRENKNPTVLPEQAYCVTRILEGIYTSSKTGQAFVF